MAGSETASEAKSAAPLMSLDVPVNIALFLSSDAGRA
jgi:hypothetical protein